MKKYIYCWVKTIIRNQLKSCSQGNNMNDSNIIIFENNFKKTIAKNIMNGSWIKNYNKNINYKII